MVFHTPGLTISDIFMGSMWLLTDDKNLEKEHHGTYHN